MLKHRNSLQKSLCPVVICPYLRSSDKRSQRVLQQAVEALRQLGRQPMHHGLGRETARRRRSHQQTVYSTTCLIEASVISNTTAHTSDAHDKLAIILINCCCNCALSPHLFSILPERGGNTRPLHKPPSGERSPRRWSFGTFKGHFGIETRHTSAM